MTSNLYLDYEWGGNCEYRVTNILTGELVDCYFYDRMKVINGEKNLEEVLFDNCKGAIRSLVGSNEYSEDDIQQGVDDLYRFLLFPIIGDLVEIANWKKIDLDWKEKFQSAIDRKNLIFQKIQKSPII